MFFRQCTEVSEKTAKFERKHFPFEHNKLGISDEVIPRELGFCRPGETHFPRVRQHGGGQRGGPEVAEHEQVADPHPAAVLGDAQEFTVDKSAAAQLFPERLVAGTGSESGFDQQAVMRADEFIAVLKDAKLAISGDHNAIDYAKAPKGC